MFFIFGHPRSGTTLLAQCLNAHSQIVIPYETDFIVPASFIFASVKEPAAGRHLITELITSSQYFDSHLGEYLSREDIAPLVNEAPYDLLAIISSIYSAVARRANKLLAGDKSPNDIHFLRLPYYVGLLNAPTKIIHIVRDVRDVVTSLIRQNWVPDIDTYYARTWSADNLYLNGLFRAEPDRYKLMRYEDLVTETENSLQTLCAFLGVEFEPEMLNTSGFSERYRIYPAHSNLYSPISGKHVGEWKTQATAEQISRYEKQARGGLVYFGYL